MGVMEQKTALILYSAFNLSNSSSPVVHMGKLLHRMGLEVDVAFQDSEEVARACERYSLTPIPLEAPVTYMMHWKVARQHHRLQRYSLLVWLTDDLTRLLPYLDPLPYAAKVLWAHGSAALSESSLKTNLESLLKFDYVLFTHVGALRAASRLLNPMGHRPPSFQLSGPGFSDDRLTILLLDLLYPTTPPPPADPVAVDKPGPPTNTSPLWDPSAPGGPLQPVHHSGPTCPNRKPARLAIALHLATYPVAWLHPVFHIMRTQPVSSHLWLTLFGQANARAVLQAATGAQVVCHLMSVRNKGLDIGPFFIVLWQIFTCRYSYDYILKFHFKSTEISHMSRQAAMYFHYTDFLKVAIDTLDSHRNYSTIYPNVSVDASIIIHDSDFLYFGINHDYIRELSAALRLPALPKVFLSGNVFLTRMEVFTRWLGNPDKLWRFYLQLNDIDGLDWRWYNHYNFKNRCERRQIEWHFRQHMGSSRYYGNVYAIPDYRSLLRDGMVEHAWERVISFMMSAGGAIAPLPVPYACLPAKKCPSLRGLTPNATLAPPTAPDDKTPAPPRSRRR
eukprot:EG_transcript_6753